ncbi:TIGR02265 family protein [Archangium violaceum]|uniref:TIGR02265 family protein n=1 Tax=Archangium violaceum TaxID=83451 RepID=UPI0019513F40|nr:TIGR02265 family protein [Archangium violaceum]QRN93624.1 TIGR02265 family protein [Archangium violaceum]
MPSDKADLAARLVVAQRGDSVLGLFFQTVFDLVQQRAGEGGLERLRAGGFIREHGELRMYPVQDFLHLLYAAGDVMEGVFGFPEAVFRACGEHGVARYDSGPGRFVFGVIARGDPHKFFSVVQLGYSGAVTYGRREYLRTGAKSGVLSTTGDMVPPAYHEGVLVGALRVLKLQGRAQARPLSIDRVEYDISWS